MFLNASAVNLVTNVQPTELRHQQPVQVAFTVQKVLQFQLHSVRQVVTAKPLLKWSSRALMDLTLLLLVKRVALPQTLVLM